MLDEEYFLFIRCLLEISLESWSRTRKLNPEGNDAIHFNASFQKATPLSRYHFASSRALSFSFFLLFFFFFLLFRLSETPTLL